MMDGRRVQQSTFTLLSRLWLHEPDANLIACAVADLGLPPAAPHELASAYADLFLLNVYPYGTAYTDPENELNGPSAHRLAALYASHGYQPAELNLVGAPDHLGLCLGFLANGGNMGSSHDVLEWAPVCCLAAERDPSAHPFYRALAVSTRDALLSGATPATSRTPRAFGATPEDADVQLRDIVRFFLAPACCGVFLSRSRLGQMAKIVQMRLPFGSRFEVAGLLFQTAGESGQVDTLLSALEAEIDQWAKVYRAWSSDYPAWPPFAARWLERTDAAHRMLAEMRVALQSPLELESQAHVAAHAGGIL